MKQRIATVIRVLIVVAIFLAMILGARAVLAAEIVNQGAGSNAVTPWKVRLTTTTGTALDSASIGAPYITAGAPAFNVSVSTVSAAATALTAGALYRVACTATTFFRTGAGTPVALTTDAPMFGPSVEYVALPTGSTAFAFVTAAGTGSCVGTLITAVP